MENLIQSLVCQSGVQIQDRGNLQRELENEVKFFMERILKLVVAESHPTTSPAAVNISYPSAKNTKVRILCVGHSVLTRKDIVSIFQEEFSRKFGIELSDKAIETPVLNYKKMKTFDLLKKLKSNKYNFVIVGPRPHSTANKGIKTSLLGFKLKHNLKAIITDYHDGPLNRAFLSHIAKVATENWN